MCTSNPPGQAARDRLRNKVEALSKKLSSLLTKWQHELDSIHEGSRDNFLEAGQFPELNKSELMKNVEYVDSVFDSMLGQSALTPDQCLDKGILFGKHRQCRDLLTRLRATVKEPGQSMKGLQLLGRFWEERHAEVKKLQLALQSNFFDPQRYYSASKVIDLVPAEGSGPTVSVRRSGMLNFLQQHLDLARRCLADVNARIHVSTGALDQHERTWEDLMQ